MDKPKNRNLTEQVSIDKLTLTLVDAAVLDVFNLEMERRMIYSSSRILVN